MKQLRILGFIAIVALAFTACTATSYKKTASGLKYKIIEGNSKGEIVDGQILKMEMIQKISGHKDTVVQNTYGRVPIFYKKQPLPQGQPVYGPEEVLNDLKKGDSLIAIVYIDSAIKKGLAQEAMLPPYMKKGDKITYTFKVVDVIANDSIANIEYQKAMEKDAPRQKKEQEEMMEKAKAEHEKQMKEEEAALEKSGEKAKLVKEIENYLAAKKIAAIKTPAGAYMKIDEPGTGAAATTGKYVTVTYTGKYLKTDSTFETNTFTYQVEKQGMIKGFEEGVKQLKQGGKGTVYIPGYLAYGKNPPAGSPFKAYEPLYFELNIKAVSDTMPAQQPIPQPQPQEQKKNEPAKKKK